MQGKIDCCNAKLEICSAMLKSEGSLKLHVKDLHERPTEKNIRC